MAIVIDGKIVADKIKADLELKTKELLANKGIKPGLALLLVGENAASQVYVNMKAKTCQKIGFHSIIERLPSDTTEKQILELIKSWNNSDLVHGILVQLPLPKHIDEQKVIECINPNKDVDGFHPINVGKMLIGLPALLPCTPAGIMELFKFYNISLAGKNAVVLGRSNIVGKPIASLMLQKGKHANATVTICHSGTPNLAEYTKRADILVVAMGSPEFIKADMVKEGAIIIDVGTNRVDEPIGDKAYRLCGDVDYADVFEKVAAISPSPGGVGPMTIAMLMQNTYNVAAGKYDK
ncbi:MAG TPA: bifunctional methylenetetrahydrofolate dehydrogenase/methenyltetrahydrofolate cyclohydrolase FolD [Candidatus Kapabacteria bacterium]|nr:bifunctional methylenetetrahydrofolate dehydrogenase/methenyltetrahydrofolate cyclohydrolase FolD [Candidatus Kapabacteria bacterium]